MSCILRLRMNRAPLREKAGTLRGHSSSFTSCVLEDVNISRLNRCYILHLCSCIKRGCCDGLSLSLSSFIRLLTSPQVSTIYRLLRRKLLKRAPQDYINRHINASTSLRSTSTRHENAMPALRNLVSTVAAACTTKPRSKSDVSILPLVTRSLAHVVLASSPPTILWQGRLALPHPLRASTFP
jgi:hypothetical protein